MNGIGGASITLAIVESSSGAASAASMKPAITSGRGRQDQHPADDLRDLVQPELEARGDAEVAAAAADRPEEVGLALLVACTSSPSAVTTSAASRSSIVRPCFRTRKPTPPPRVIPPIPTEPVSPKPGGEAVARRRRWCTRPP